MSEPTNPLFEEEKAFLERKKLEYERALRGDVAMLKEQAGHAGRIAAVGAGLAGSIWLITKVFSSRTKPQPMREAYDSYGPDEYPTQHFGDYDPYDEATDYRDTRWRDAEADTTYNYFADPDDAHGTVYHTDTDQYDTPNAYANEADDAPAPAAAAEDDQPAPLTFPHHTGPAANPGHDAERFESEAYGHPESTLPFDDSRRLPESEDFQTDDDNNQKDEDEQFERRIPTPPAKPKRNLGSMLVGLARTSVGKVVVGQAFSLGLGLAAKAIRQKLEHDGAETPKTSDLADATGDTNGSPATPQPDADYSSVEDAPTF